MPRSSSPTARTWRCVSPRSPAFYAGPWLAGIRERYGMDPQIKLLETPCITDNAIGAVLLPDAAEQPGASQRRLRQSTVSVPAEGCQVRIQAANEMATFR